MKEGFMVIIMGICILLFIGVIIHTQSTESIEDTLQVGLTPLPQPAFDNLKADCYTQGYIDGGASVLSEHRSGSYVPMGVPPGYESNRTPEWRAYADCIAYDTGCSESIAIYGGSWVASI